MTCWRRVRRLREGHKAKLMRVTMLNKYYPPHLGGIEFHVRDLAEGLVEREGAKVSALVANDGPGSVREMLGGVEVMRMSRFAQYASTPIALGMRQQLRFLLSGPEASDVLHLHFPYPWGEISWLSMNARVPAVMTYHSDIVRQKTSLALYKPLLEKVLDRVDLIIASSPNMVEHSEFLAPRAEKCRVVPFGLHVERFAATQELLERAARLKARHSHRKVVLFVGRLVYYKGVDVLLRAMSDVDADLVIIGKGPLESELREQAHSQGIASRVFFEPPVSDEDLTAWYHASDVFCLPSVARSEAFGLVQVEAHASGLPVVSTDLTTGVPFVNADGVTGLVVPPGDSSALARALGTLLSDDDLRRRLGEQARSRANAEFSIERMVTQTVSVYREAIEGQRR